MGNCEDFCHEEPQLDNEDIDGSAAVKTQKHKNHKDHSNIACQLCTLSVQYAKFKDHLDFCHFGVFEKKADLFTVCCILCGFQTLSLKGFKDHLDFRHKYLKEQERKNLSSYKRSSNIKNYQSLKKKIKEVKKQDFSLLRVKVDAPNLYLAKINSKKTDAIVNQKYYSSMQFHKDRVLGDLVYRYVFTEYPQVESYSLHCEAEQKKILCRATLFLPSDE